ncbi:bifunctional phosphopantothenoylcysteine decarboxylase/phosphopantothenate--cysteine ligase CoaBC [Dubosiella newyorkensis]|jgi:phosphopantothenoylcysteine decarboxylase/phosphopantothenate--cysteine ligase|uniref:bifunctional phosphopantothenoylcysteine decarboxylase/phosphopantothenate--cysteine ligase CoaBC n=1 Tax=Dubosiella newyorkensis TaxID=1862672 RepID=UPI002353FF36|nr:bifunctional phosphopantothenoylcysteine decarboxylase/phosphopantothenate--cysteine ligase CoaBC [Dubosiella newyorkensis]MCI9040401.1 bifunctional phosphopantothenoylcysteine decarboxylase/phosphopantothenate--cysteine ligase CoaBC [Dubosiella newyorkensis]
MQKKNILIAVSGGIAAYKVCDLVSRLGKKGYSIKVIMTRSATQFVAPITFEALSHNKCESQVFDETNEDPIAHITLAKWADVFVLVPATANIIAKIVHGIADDLVSTTALACYCPKIICPAMNVHMYENTVTQENILRAKQLGYTIVEPETGLLACQDVGKGKLASLDTIQEAIESIFDEKLLEGKRVLVNAGPTIEALDPVRFISNHSSGKQGYAIAQAAKKLGAKVTLISGPVALEPIPGIETIYIQSAQDMMDAVQARFEDNDYFILAAAISDYRPKETAPQKMKKQGDTMEIELVKNPDILAWLGAHKKEGQIVCGFAMETENLEHNAQEKCVKKHCDLLIGNNLFTQGAGFQTPTNVVTLFTKDTIQPLGKMSKEEVGELILKTMKQMEDHNTCS